MSDREMRVFILLMLGVFLINCVACAKKDDSKPSKDLFSLWHSDNNGDLDLQNAHFGVMPIQLAYAPNAGCYCTIEIVGTQSSGTASLSGCTNYGPTNYCSSGLTIYNYTNQSATLTLCNQFGSNCEIYR